MSAFAAERIYTEDPDPSRTQLVGGFGTVFTHETFHAIVGLANGWDVDKFRPFPHICGGRLVGGCVHVIPPAGISASKKKSDSRWISAAGSIGNLLLGSALIPYAATLQRGTVRRYHLESLIFYQIWDWPIYTIYEVIFPFKGDWYSVSKSTGIPLLVFPIIAAGASYTIETKLRAPMLEEEEPEAMSWGHFLRTSSLSLLRWKITF